MCLFFRQYCKLLIDNVLQRFKNNATAVILFYEGFEVHRFSISVTNGLYLYAHLLSAVRGGTFSALGVPHIPFGR